MRLLSRPSKLPVVEWGLSRLLLSYILKEIDDLSITVFRDTLLSPRAVVGLIL